MQIRGSTGSVGIIDPPSNNNVSRLENRGRVEASLARRECEPSGEPRCRVRRRVLSGAYFCAVRLALALVGGLLVSSSVYADLPGTIIIGHDQRRNNRGIIA